MTEFICKSLQVIPFCHRDPVLHSVYLVSVGDVFDLIQYVG